MSSGTVKNVDLVNLDVFVSASAIGSLVGHNDQGAVIQCRSSGLVEGERSVGRLVGYSQGEIAGSCSSGTVTGPGMGTYVGGLVGGTAGSVTTSRSTGIVAGNAFVGGLAGHNHGSIVACYSEGAVTGRDRVGGFAGHNSRSIALCYSTGAVTGTEHVGGFAGGNYLDADIASSFWDIQTSGANGSEGGAGKTTAEMQMAATFIDAGWDFENVWTICEGRDYPRLRWEPVECEVGP